MPIELQPGDKIAQFPGDAVTYSVWDVEAASVRAWLPPRAVMPTVAQTNRVIAVAGGHSGAAYRIGTDTVFCTLFITAKPLVLRGHMVPDGQQSRVNLETAGDPPQFGEVVIYRNGRTLRKKVRG